MPSRIDSGFLGAARSASPAGQGEDPQKQPSLLSLGAIYLAGPPVLPPSKAASLSPNYRPFPLEEVGNVIRERMFHVAAQCFLKATGKPPKGLNDADALKAASVTPETTPEALQKVIEKNVAEVRREYQERIKKAKTPEEKAALVRGQKEVETLLRTKMKRGRALVDSKPPRILIDPKLYAAAKAGGNIPDEGSAMKVYRRTFLEEQAHIYLHLRGIDIYTEPKVSLDEMLTEVHLRLRDTCHHMAIPIAKNNYKLASTK